ncbi:NADH dehydrogenase, partial [Tribonema minus]
VAQGLRNAIFKSGGGFLGGSTAPIMDLYRSICREIPRVLTIYDVDMDPAVARRKVNELFRKNGHLQDPEVIKIVVSKGYMELEETVLQFKQRTHLMRLL